MVELLRGGSSIGGVQLGMTFERLRGDFSISIYDWIWERIEEKVRESRKEDGLEKWWLCGDGGTASRSQCEEPSI